MANYGLKYSQYVGKDDSRVLIQVYVKGWTGRSYGMAHIQSASLQVVGGNSDVLTPVIKTSFSWSLADCWDEGTTKADGTTCVNALFEKCGQWEEFFTPDATKFKVVVSAAPVGELARAIWTGFVTPDSWSEDLIYRGSITITARDMLGSLQEMEFNLSGRPSVLQLIQGALSACSCAMQINYNQAHFLENSDGYSLLSHNVGAMAYGGKSWWEALTGTLESLGLVMRWNGQNQVVLTSLRYLAEDTQDGYHEMEFINRSGMRSLAAALKLVTETFDVEMKDLPFPDPELSQISPDLPNMVQHQSGSMAVSPQDVTVPRYLITPPSGGGWSGHMCVPRPTYLGRDVPDRNIYFVPDLTSDQDTTFARPGLVPPFTLSVKQEGGVMVYFPGNVSSIENRAETVDHTIASIQLVIRCKTNGSYRYLTENGWNAQYTEPLTIAPGDEIPLPALANPSDLEIIVRKITTTNHGFNTSTLDNSFFVVALAFEIITPREVATPLEFKTTTEYDLQNNVTITRTPKIASADAALSLDFCPNVLGIGAAVAPDEWNWPGEEDYYPLAVMIQAQVLCFYSAPASIFTGTAHDGSVALPGYGLRYFGRDCVIIAGTYEFATGFIAQLNAREVYSWEDVWGDTFAPEYTQKSSPTKGGTDATGRWTDGLPRIPGGAFNAEEFSEDFQITRQ